MFSVFSVLTTVPDTLGDREGVSCVKRHLENILKSIHKVAYIYIEAPGKHEKHEKLPL